MSIDFKKTNIENVYIVEPHRYVDQRGLYLKYYEKEVFAAYGVFCKFNESSEIYSFSKGTLRGLHYQTKHPQAKLLHVISGRLFDVVVDLRNESKTYGKYYADILDGSNHKAIYVPERFAHGFISLSENTIFSYQCSGRYIPEACGGIRWDSPDLDIPWPLEQYGIKHVTATFKDLNWPTFTEFRENNIKFESEL